MPDTRPDMADVVRNFYAGFYPLQSFAGERFILMDKAD